MSVTSIVGAQWGDEGKGRIVDYLAQKADIVIRYQGGDNAGHTVMNEYGKFALHIIPSGIFNEDALSIVGAGTVVNFDTMTQELSTIPEKFHDNLLIDYRAHLIMPYHCALDGAEEAKRSDSQKIGTTKRGIGPCYSDKSARNGFRAGELLDLDAFRTRLEAQLPRKNRELEFFGLPTFTVDEIMEKCKEWKERYALHITDTVPIVREAVESGRNIVMEGQLGIMRDLDWGIYPFCTSSNPTAGGAANTGAVPPNRIDQIVGVSKAYLTSVGGGPLPTELFDEDGKKMRDIGHEYGATTGRPRRTGWIDIVALDYSAYINGMTALAITKLDVLDTFPKVKICTGYMIEGEYVTQLPDTARQALAKPIYEEMDGWMCDTSSARKWEDLPKAAQAFIKRVEELVNVPVKYISVGPERDQIIIL